MKLKNSTYDFLKWFALIGLNAFGTFYSTIGVVWGLPYVEQIKTTCFALGTFIGACIGISSANYYADEEEKHTDE